ncbi:hypothetical protein [Maribacter sp. IgM3_T14_3]|uniref:hypothetical protein n=1 Tax=Maribacter sp. IgM3_T14_3 TaxID=3415140 RepID=UPI003C6EF9FF
MKNKSKIDHLVEDTLESTSSIDSVKIPPFFKEKVLQRMAQNDDKKATSVRYLDWFTPRYQAAALVCLLILNTFALLSYKGDNSYSEKVEDFAELYGLSETSAASYLYQN